MITSLALTACTLRTAEPAPTLPVDDRRKVSVGIGGRRGYALFTGRAQCSSCHALASADDAAAVLDDLAIAHDASGLGRFLFTRDPADLGSFKTPSLRNVGVTAPYLHDGSLVTLQEAVAFFAGRHASAPLTAAETEDLVAFLLTLTDHRLATQQAAAFTRQRGSHPPPAE